MAKLEESSESRLYESLSALMDGEASEIEVRQILKSLGDDSSDKELLSKWERFQLIRSAMRGELAYQEPLHVAANISEAIANEPDLKSSEQIKSSVWPNLGRFAVAASVAAALVVGVQFSSVNTSINVVDLPAQTPAPASGSPVLDGKGGASINVVRHSDVRSEAKKEEINITDETREQLQLMEGEINRLMLEHAQNSSQNTQQGVVPYMRVPDSDQK